MHSQETKLELRNGEIIRAYLDELARLKTPVQFSLPASDAKPFETTLENVSPITFSSTTTPRLEPGQMLNLTFMLDARRFIAHVRVVASGVFKIPVSIAQGERRARFRGAFERTELAQVLAVEECSETLFGGRTLQGKLLDLSDQGLRVALGEVGVLSGPGKDLAPGDRFASVCITGLPFTPPIHCRGIVAHVARTCAEPFAGLALEGLAEGDQNNIERILAPRYPTTFGEAFPAKKRRTELADQLGTPTSTKVRAKAPEIVRTAAEVAQDAAAARPVTTALMRLRKAGKKIMLLSENAASPALAEAFREDGFKQVAEARSFVEAKTLAGAAAFDLLVLDIRVGTHWGGDMMKALRAHDLLLETPIILLVDYRNDGSNAIAGTLDAVHIHERRKPFDELAPVVYKLLLE